MKVLDTDLPGCVVIEPKVFEDARGFFYESFNCDRLAAHGLDFRFVQGNVSASKRGVLRGLHYQWPKPQGKYVTVLEGEVWDVAVDIRRGSPTYGRWVGVELSAEAGNQLYIPAGFLHGFAVLEPNSELLYKCSDFYAPDCDGAVRFDDPDIGIDWGIDPKAAILSDKDAKAPFLKDFVSPFVYEG